MKEDYPGQFDSFRLRQQGVVAAELEFVLRKLMEQTLDEIRALPEIEA